jgi:response regulator RpfG family c-di-GMP phosphodiesterase/tRNA A-37 threonylcarbamoyl transferase component Bud32
MLGLSTRLPPSTKCLLQGDSQSFGVQKPTLLNDLLSSTIVLSQDWEALPQDVQARMSRCSDPQQLLAQLVEHRLLTEYQAARVNSGTHYGLVLGNYRVLDRIGAGGMAVVFKAEHVEMRHVVAIKVLPLGPDVDPRLQTRFMAEMRTVARLRHPNIVAAMDAGRLASADPDTPLLMYLVMEYVAGLDLQDLVQTRGPLEPHQACNLIFQIAGALAETHKYQMVHRDIKPSNILVTEEDQAKLLDFGLSLHVDTDLTQPGTVVGTIDYMSPEQADNASAVDIRADIYGLGGTLFWCLTGQVPFPSEKTLATSLVRRRTQGAPSARQLAPTVPAELDTVIGRMMAMQADKRYATPGAVMKALLPFLQAEGTERIILEHGMPLSAHSAKVQVQPAPAARAHRVLIVDDEAALRIFCVQILTAQGLICSEARCGRSGLEAAETGSYDLILLDVELPHMRGGEVLKHLRESPPSPHLKIIMYSGSATPDEMAHLLIAGADEYLTKPFSIVQLQGRVQAALRLKDAQDRSALLNRNLLALNDELERNLRSSCSDLVQSRNALVLALAKLVERRDSDSSAHVIRLQRYCRTLAEQAATLPVFAGEIDALFIEMLECCAPLHDIGKVALPDHILLKPGELMPDERIVMQAHTTIGATALQEVAQNNGTSLAFLQMAIDITRSHHEHYDGSGYPDRLAGSAIPLAARLVRICDVYDALRSRRVYKPALTHAATVQVMTEASAGQFDPALLQAFLVCSEEFARIFREITD